MPFHLNELLGKKQGNLLKNFRKKIYKFAKMKMIDNHPVLAKNEYFI